MFVEVIFHVEIVLIIYIYILGIDVLVKLFSIACKLAKPHICSESVCYISLKKKCIFKL